MLDIVILLSLTIYALSSLLTVFRMVLGPDLPDRILSLDSLHMNAIALIILFGVYLGSSAFFEAALLIAMMGFVGTAAACKYILRGNIIE